ncbi:MAG: L-threonylcarbamoyladenylate synthase [Patescibacteria group bacterium]
MEIVTQCNLAKIVSELIFGKTIVFPTETSYGLGCDATNQTAVNKIYLIKGRPDNKPLLIVVPNIEMAKKILAWNKIIDRLAEKYWPGALTIVGEATKTESWATNLARGVISEDNTVAVRVTADPLLKSITEKLGRPLVATSANYSAEGDNYRADEVIENFKDKDARPDIILNNGELPKNLPSTIVRVYSDRFVVVRQGEIKISI